MLKYSLTESTYIYPHGYQLTERLLYLYSGKLLDGKEWTADAHYNIHEFHKHAKWKKLCMKKARSVIQFIWNYREQAKVGYGWKIRRVVASGNGGSNWLGTGEEGAFFYCNFLYVDRDLSYSGIGFVQTPQMCTLYFVHFIVCKFCFKGKKTS